MTRGVDLDVGIDSQSRRRDQFHDGEENQSHNGEADQSHNGETARREERKQGRDATRVLWSIPALVLPVHPPVRRRQGKPRCACVRACVRASGSERGGCSANGDALAGNGGWGLEGFAFRRRCDRLVGRCVGLFVRLNAHR